MFLRLLVSFLFYSTLGSVIARKNKKHATVVPHHRPALRPRGRIRDLSQDFRMDLYAGLDLCTHLYVESRRNYSTTSLLYRSSSYFYESVLFYK